MDIVNSSAAIRTVSWRVPRSGQLVRYQETYAIVTHLGLFAFDGRAWGNATLGQADAQVEVMNPGFMIELIQKS